MRSIVLVIVLSVISFALYADRIVLNEPVSIYLDFANGTFGHTIHRDQLWTVNEPAFRRSQTFAVDSNIASFLTAVVIDRSVIEELEKIFKKEGNVLNLGEYQITLNTVLAARSLTPVTVYRFQSRRTGLDLSFSVDVAPASMLNIINRVYSDDDFWRTEVGDIYRKNYVIRIHAAHNLSEPWHQEVRFADAMLMATLIGNVEQTLWGIHDGNGLLAKALSLA